MSESIIQFIERMFVGPVWPASVMVGVMLVYAIVVAIGLLDVDLSAEPDVDAGEAVFESAAEGGTVSGMGAMTLRWLNLGKIPLVVWLSIFASLFWAISYGMWYGFDSRHYAPSILPTVLLTIRNLVVTVGLTKPITDRLGFLSRRGPTFEAGKLIGQTCEVSSSEVSPTFGQAKFKTDAAPLLLNIRIDRGSLPRGTLVQIIDFDSQQRVYKVAAASREDIQ